MCTVNIRRPYNTLALPCERVIEQVELQASLQRRQLQQGLVQVRVFYACSRAHSGKSGPKDQVALHYYYTSPSHWCTTHEVSKL